MYKFILIIAFFVASSYADEVHEIASFDNVDKLSSYLSKNPSLIDLEDIESFYDTPLISAIKNVNEENAIFLVKKGASIEKSKNGFAPALSYAINPLLNDTGNHETYAGFNLYRLIVANSGMPKLIQELIAHGADVNYVDDNGQTLLGLAFLQDNNLIIRRLMEDRSLDLSIKNNNNESLLDLMPNYYKKLFGH